MKPERSCPVPHWHPEGGDAALAAVPEVGRGTGYTVLCVDDQPEVRTLMAEVLRLEGYRVLEAADGLDAIRVCQRHRGPVHLLVSDVRMPHINGQELALELAMTRPEMRFLYVSGYSPGLLPFRDARTPFLPKPLDVLELLDVAHRILHPGGEGERGVRPRLAHAAPAGLLAASCA